MKMRPSVLATSIFGPQDAHRETPWVMCARFVHSFLLGCLLGCQVACSSADGDGGAGARGGGSAQAGASAGSTGAGGASGAAGSSSVGGRGGAAGSAVGGADAGVVAAGGADAGAASMPDARAPDEPFPATTVFATKRETYLTNGAGRTEGIAARGDDLFFCGDRGGVFRLDAQKRLFLFLQATDCGAVFDGRDGTLLVAFGRKGLAQIFADGRVGILAELPGSVGFANDLTVDARGNVYFTNNQRGDVVRVTPVGEVTVVASWAGANGVEVDPASERLYVNGTGGVVRYPLTADGVGVRETFTTALKSPDGCTFDAWGNYWVADAAGELAVFDARKQLLGSWTGLGGDFSNVTFGGPNDEVLFATHGSAIERFAVGVRGFRGHRAAPSYKVLREDPAKVVDRPM